MTVLIADLRAHIETDLTDPALQRLLDDVDSEVFERFGDDQELTVDLCGSTTTVRLYRPVDFTVTIGEITVTERDSRDDDPETLVLDTDYAVLHGGRTLLRFGDAVRWKRVVTVTYMPTPEEELRDRITVDLVKLAVNYNGFNKQEQIGDYRAATFDDYTKEREKLLMAVVNRRSGMRFE